MNNTLKIVLGLGIGLFALAMIWKALNFALYLGVALGIGYIALRKIAPSLVGVKKKTEDEQK